MKVLITFKHQQFQIFEMKIPLPCFVHCHVFFGLLCYSRGFQPHLETYGCQTELQICWQLFGALRMWSVSDNLCIGSDISYAFCALDVLLVLRIVGWTCVM